MPLSSVPSEDDIMTKLRTIPGVDVIEGEYTQDSYIPVLDANKMFKPYLLVKFNGSFPSYDNGIVSPDLDSQRASFSVFVVTPTDRTTRLIRDQVRVKMLTDFIPTDGSTLRPTGGYSFVDSDLGYQRYAANIGFAYLHNLS